jgi:pyruvate dehydrogenase E2 component (dihydrolipoamide acetyltransferase)
MAYIVRMANLGMSMHQGEVLEWYLDVGDAVEEGDALLEIEAEKTTSEIIAKEDGVLRRVYAEGGDVTEPGAPLGIVAANSADSDNSGSQPAIERTKGNGKTQQQQDDTSGIVRLTPKAKRRARELGVDTDSISAPGSGAVVDAEDIEEIASRDSADTQQQDDDGGGTVRLTPKAKRRARELGVDTDSISAPGNGTVLDAEDIEEIAADEPGNRTIREEREFSQMRQSIAERLGESYRNAVHVTHDRAIDLEAGLEVVDQLKPEVADISVIDMILLAVSETLEEHPQFNATFEDEVHRLYEEHNIGFAVDVDEGLVTPVISDVENRSLTELIDERRTLTERALAGDYTMDDLAGGTFTVSNLGVLNVDSFTPIIDPPQIAILGVGRPRQKAVQDGNDVAFRRHVTFSLSFDHRVVDGADAARFLETFATRLQNPRELLSDAMSEDITTSE